MLVLYFSENLTLILEAKVILWLVVISDVLDYMLSCVADIPMEVTMAFFSPFWMSASVAVIMFFLPAYKCS